MLILLVKETVITIIQQLGGDNDIMDGGKIHVKVIIQVFIISSF